MSPGRITIGVLASALLVACSTNAPPSPLERPDGAVSQVSITLKGHALRPNRHFSFEDTSVASPLLSTEQAYSGLRSLDLSGITYGPVIRSRTSDVADDLSSVATGCWLLSSAERPRIGFVMSIRRGGQQVAWFGKELRPNEHDPGKWERFNAEFLLRETNVLPDDSIVYYIWHRDRDPLFVDDLDLFFHSANVPGRPPGTAVHVDSMTIAHLPLPTAPCTCDPFPLLERSRLRIIGEHADSLGIPADSVPLANGVSWYRTASMPMAELRDAQGRSVAWVRPFCPTLGVDLLSFERVIVRADGPGRLLIIAFDVDDRDGQAVVAAAPPPVAATLTVQWPGTP